MGIAENLKALRELRGWSQPRLASEAGVSQQLISQLENGVNATTKKLPDIARALGAKVSEIDPTWGQPSEVREAVGMALPNRTSMPLDVPVYGTVAGSDFVKGAFQLEPEIVDYVRRPPGLASAKDVYALYVEGSSMSPRFDPGELIYVNPRRPVRPGDYVVIQEPVDDETIRAFVKLFIKRAGEWIIVQQLNPKGEMRFKATDALRLHRVLTITDLMGV